MTWFKVDDEKPSHPKMLRAGKDARCLWDAAGPMCAKHNTDGLVEPATMKLAAFLADVKRPTVAARALVDAGLWHDAETIKSCPRCLEASGGAIAAGHFYFHDWNEYQLSKASQSSPETQSKDAKRRRLSRDKRLLEQIRDRDGTLCRYCGKRVNFLDHHSVDGGTYDHIDPDGPNTLDNVVVACRGCNSYKGERTPAEAGMTLLDPGTARVRLISTPPGEDGAVDLPPPGEERAEQSPPAAEDSTAPPTALASTHTRLRTGAERAGDGAKIGAVDGAVDGAEPAGTGDGSEPGQARSDPPSDDQSSDEVAS